MAGFFDYLRMMLGWKSSAVQQSGALCFTTGVEPALDFNLTLQPALNFTVTVEPALDFDLTIGCD